MATPLLILGLLFTPLLIGGLISLRTGGIVPVAWLGCWGVTLVFCFTGTGHFIQTESMAEMLPAWLPGRVPLVYLTGVMEFILAFCILRNHSRATVGWILIVMLALFLPVNIYAAMNRLGMGGHLWGPVYLLIRIPLQVILIGWIWNFAIYRNPLARAPICFSLSESIQRSPEEIAGEILELSNWTAFQGAGFLPGIKHAEFEIRTEQVTGTRIHVTNMDGSEHIEEIIKWDLPHEIKLKMDSFSPPLSKLATHFTETWNFVADDHPTLVRRSFELFPANSLSRIVLCGISFPFRTAIRRHLNQMKDRPQSLHESN